MSGYGKLFASMYDGTLYGRWQALVTFQQFIILCDSQGVVDMTPHAIAARTSIPLEIIQKGIDELEQPDPYSRTPDEEGRRIERLDDHRPWGWRIVNHDKYRAMLSLEQKREADRDRIAAKRAALKQGDMLLDSATGSDKPTDVAKTNGVSRAVADVAHAEAEAEAEATTEADQSKRARKKSRPSRRVPEDFDPDRQMAEDNVPDMDVDEEIRRFRDHEFQTARSDWAAVWRNWVRTCRDGGRYAKRVRRAKTVAELEAEEIARNAQH